MNLRRMQAALAAASLLLVPTLSEASSHREAPFIARMPKVDNTDFYMFRSYESGRAGFVTIIANFQPLQDAYGGPNYFTMDPDALYEIHIDNSGDAKEDLTFQFRFQNPLNDASGQTGITLDIGPTGMTQKVSIPFINANLPGAPANPLTAANQASFRNIREAYTMKVVRGDRRTGMAGDITNAAGGGTSFVKPLDFVGTKTFGSVAEYDTYANQHIYNAKIPAGPTACTAGADIKVFVGQRQEGFAVLLGNIFDLVNASAAQLTDAAGGTLGNPIGNKNVTTIALEVPIACLKGASDVIGGWSTASVRQARAINPNATYGRPSREGGAWAQVSRLGSPLVNEVVIGIKDKDKFNSSKPSDDVANFGVYITNPTLPAVLEGLFGAANVKAPTVFPRTDLLAAFATGVPGVNAFPGSPTPAEMLRLNTALPATPKGSQQRLGAALCFKAGATPNDPKVLDTGNPGCDPAGFPNGRRPGDDTVDIALRVAMGYLLGSGVGTSTRAPNADLPLGDFVPQNDSQFLDAFPYLNAPNPGAQ